MANSSKPSTPNSAKNTPIEFAVFYERSKNPMTGSYEHVRQRNPAVCCRLLKWFGHRDDLVCSNIVQFLHDTAGPGDHHLGCDRLRSESEMNRPEA